MNTIPPYTNLTIPNNLQLPKNYTIEKELGKGTYSTVFLAKDPSGALVALKKYAIEDFTLKETLEREGADLQKMIAFLVEKETSIGSLIESPHVVSVKNSWIDGEVGYVVMPYIEGQTFDISTPYTTKERFSFAYQFLEALTHLVEREIVPSDLWSENILITPAHTLVLIDLGGHDLLKEADLPFLHYQEMIENCLDNILGSIDPFFSLNPFEELKEKPVDRLGIEPLKQLLASLKSAVTMREKQAF